ncbi:MAG: hypothetical protein QXJ56_00100 [Ignisphaera sp.]|uniref:Uncharacterized protein n=1 Tax=Ignisphaera aggregans TaxID=334771 RepID=A0A7J3I933_9CREN
MMNPIGSLDELLDNITVCVLLMNDRSGYKEFVDCIPEALHAIYRISMALGVKMRYPTISMILNYTRGFNKLEEFDIEEIIELLKELVNNSNRENPNRILQRISRIAMGREIAVNVNPKDALELLLATLYAMFLSTLDDSEEYVQEIPIISIPQTSVGTITV